MQRRRLIMRDAHPHNLTISRLVRRPCLRVAEAMFVGNTGHWAGERVAALVGTTILDAK